MSARITEATNRIETIAHRWAHAAYCKALGKPFEDIDAIKKELRAALAAALSTEPGEVEGHTVEISRMGWEEDDGEQRFKATAVFKEPPNWPFNVVWKRIPVRMALATPLPEDTHHGR